MRRKVFVLVLFQALVAAAAGHAAAATYFETVDAGQLPELARDVAVAGPVDAIVGRIEHAFDADLFRLVIDEPAAFSAAAIQPDTDAPDLQLFLFDAWGHGVAADDNWLFSPLPRISAGTLRGQTPGVFLLGVSPADDDPLGILGEIFPDVESGISEPSGLSRFDPLLDWSRDFTAAGGNYSIALAAVSGLAPLLLGDYNANGVVNAADYTVWRDNLGASIVLPNDPIGGTIGQAQYDQWKANFGQVAGSGALAAVRSPQSDLDRAIPEPATLWLMSLAIVLLNARNRARSVKSTSGV